MLKQSDITQEAIIIFEATPYSEAVTAGEVSQLTGLAQPRCQLILTQLAMAGLVKENTKENTFQNIQL
ncbi:TPA: TrmB family transcriptional regulator [Providencia alcalifaciens]